MFPSWVIPSNQAKCAAANHTVSCLFSVYSNATNLADKYKLVPNDEVTGKNIVRAFIAGAIIALILSFALLVDKIKVHYFDKGKDKKEHHHYLKLVRTLEDLMHANSEAQLVTSVALLISLNHIVCKITAYHFNLVCTMLLMGIVTHLNTLISIPDFLYKGKTVGLFRLALMIVQCGFSVIVFSARHSKNWPAKASPLAIMPAACFVNMNATSDLGLADFVDFAQNVTAGSTANSTANVTEIAHNISAVTSSNPGMAEYVTLIVFMVFALLVVFHDFFDAWTENPEGGRKQPSAAREGLRWTSIAISAISLLVSIVIVTISGLRYQTLRREMEIPAWYDDATQDEWTYSQILPILLMTSGVIVALKAFTESLAGHRGRRYIQAGEMGYKEARQIDRELTKIPGSSVDEF